MQVGLANMSKKVVFLGTGGTIAGTAASDSDNVGYKAAQLGIDQLLQSSPALRGALQGCSAETEQVLQVNSKDMEFSGWQQILGRVVHHLQRPEVVSVLVTHGTDTIEETAYFLHRAIPAGLLVNKRVVLTCAMRPASSANADGPANLCDAAAVAVSPAVAGVLVVCAGYVHAGQHVQKVHPYRLNPFDSGEVGHLAVVEEGLVRLVSSLPPSPAVHVDVDRVLAASCPRVEVLVSHAGSDGAIVRALLSDAHHQTSPVRGLVVAGTGNGAVHETLEMALKLAQAQGVLVRRTSRCAYGQIVTGAVPDPQELVPAYASAVKARIDLILELLR